MERVAVLLKRACRQFVAGDYNAANAICDDILREDHDHAQAIALAAECNRQCGRSGLAYQLYRRAAELDPGADDVWANLGMCLERPQYFDEMEAHYRTALKVSGETPEVCNNMGTLELNRGNVRAALEWTAKALQMRPGLASAQWTQALCHLMRGDWAAGWDLFDADLEARMKGDKRFPNVPRWDGRKGRNVIVTGEQGIGDEIMFASMYPDLIADARQVVIETERRLEGLFRRSFPRAAVYGTRYDPEIDWPFDHRIETMILAGSLGRHYRRSREAFPGTPFLVADPVRRLQWRALLDSLGSRPKVGIAWSGGIPNTFSGRRSVTLDTLRPLFDVPVDWISLAHKTPDLSGLPIHHWRHATQSDDYDDTAALVAELDLVVSVTTSVVHLAGALGKDCWVLVPEVAQWRYNGPDMPWYRSVRLFRQQGDWPVPAILEALHARFPG